MSIFCRKCGNELPANAKFCRKCGATTGMITSTPSEYRTSGKGTRWAIAALIVVAACGAGWYLWQGKRGASTATVSPATSATNVVSMQSAETVPHDTPKPPPSVTNTDPKLSTISPPSANQGELVQVLKAFHRNITNKNYRKAYNYLSKDFQASVSYDRWVPGFRTTVSSTVSDVKIMSQTDTQAVLSYILKAVDNPGGTQYFQGTAILIKTSEGWKIDEITNKTM